MTPEEFRRYGRQVIDWIADYYERIETFPVLSQVAPGEVARRTAGRTPGAGRAVRRRAARPRRRSSCPASRTGSTRRSSPTSRPTPAARRSWAICSSSGLGVQGMIWATSPGRHRTRDARPGLARRAARPARRASGPPAPAAGSSSTRASDAALVALLAALHRVSGGRDRARRRRRRPLRRLHLGADALVGREGLPRRRARAPTRCARSTSTRRRSPRGPTTCAS